MQSNFPDFLKSKFETELARRSFVGSWTFAALAVSVVLTNLISGPNQVIYRTLAFALVGVNIARFFLAKRFIGKIGSPAKALVALHATILMNPLFWSILFYRVYDPIYFDSHNSMIAFLITAGMVAGSAYSLSPFIFQAVAFQLGVMVHLIAFSIRSWQANPEDVSVVLPIASVVYLVYSFAQTLQNRKVIIESAQFEFSLLQSNESLRQSQKLLQEQSVKLMHASRLASLGEMAGGIAHEINNPLAIISGSLDIIKRSLDKLPGDHEKLFERIKKTQSASVRIKNIVAGLFTFAGQSESIPFEQVDANSVIKETLVFCEEKFKAKNIEISTQLDGNFQFIGRPNQISQVLLNLLNNSFDAVLGCDQKWIKIHLFQAEDYICVDVVDSGPGIPDEMKVRLFQPFATNKEVGMGTGLGLSIARGIAREHNGDLIYVEGGSHTTFRLSIPRSKEKQETTTASRSGEKHVEY